MHVNLILSVIVIAFFVVSAARASDDPELIAYGEYLSSECVTCHQISGKDNGIPPIVGWDVTSFYQVIDTYRLKVRENATMQTIAANLSDEEIKALAAYFATIKPTEE